MFRFSVVIVLLIACAVASLPPSMLQMFKAAYFSGVVAVRKGGVKEIIANDEFGTMHAASNTPMDRSARFPVGSNTKVYAAISLYMLQERGLVNLAANVSDYLSAEDFIAFGHPEIKKFCPKLANSTVCQQLTFVDLLSMSSGMSDGDPMAMFNFYPGSIGAVLGQYITLPLLFIPGTSFYYSNPAFMLASYFVEKFSNMGFWQFVKQNIHDVIGQSSTYYDPYDGQFSYDPIRTELYYDYLDNKTHERLSQGKCIDFPAGQMNGAGGFISDTDDEALLYYTLFNFSRPQSDWGKPFFKNPKTLIELTRPRTPIPNDPMTRYFAQGLWVVPGNMSIQGLFPDFVLYVGETICAQTANLFDLRYTPFLMTQVWRSAVVYFTDQKTLDKDMVARAGFFPEMISGMDSPPEVPQLAWALHNNYAPDPPVLLH